MGTKTTFTVVVSIIFVSLLTTGQFQFINAFNGSVGTQAWRFQGNGAMDTAAIGDVDGDGNLEVVSSGSNRLYCLNGNTGAEKWNATIQMPVTQVVPAIGDLDNDGKCEIVVGSYDHKVYCVYGLNGTTKWTYATGDQVTEPPALGDVDSDGQMEVIVGSWDSKLYCLEGENGTLRWNVTLPYRVTDPAFICDPAGNGSIQIIFGLYLGYVFCLNGSSGNQIWNFTRPWYFTGNVAVGDIDSDGIEEVIVLAYNVYDFYCLSGVTGALKWTASYGSVCFTNPLLCDVDRDGNVEIVLKTNANLCVYAGTGGALKWKVYTWSASDPAVADVDDDGTMEILVGNSDDYNLYCICGKNGTIEWKFLTGNSVSSTPAFSDVDGDGKLEIVFGSDDGYVYCLISTGKPWAQPGPLSCVGGSALRRNNELDSDNDGLSDQLEIAVGLNAYSPDTDTDQIVDGWEVTNGLNPLDPSDAAVDPDADGLNNLGECLNKTDYLNPDTDGDGLTDGDEVFTYLTNPLLKDTDADDLWDGVEVHSCTNPRNNDTDGDGMRDGYEVAYGLLPCDASDKLADPDGDGLTNIQEFALNTNPHSADTDNDGLSDKLEVDSNTNPLVNDTDGDYVLDGQEVLQETNPLDPLSPFINYSVSGFAISDFGENYLVNEKIDTFSFSYDATTVEYSITLCMKVVDNKIRAAIFVNTENKNYVTNLVASFSFKLFVAHANYHVCGVGSVSAQAPMISFSSQIYAYSLFEIPLGKTSPTPTTDVNLKFNFTSSEFSRSNLFDKSISTEKTEVPGVPGFPEIFLAIGCIGAIFYLMKKKSLTFRK